MTVVDSDTGEVLDFVPLDAIGTDQGVRRERVDLDHVARLALAVDDLPPIVLRRCDDGRLSIIDGTHRLAAHRRSGRVTITARIIRCSDTEALAMAVAANISHGRPLDLTDRRNAARRLIEMAPDMSDRTIADRCGLAPTTIGELRPRPGVQSGHLDTEPKRSGADGKQYPTPEMAAEARQRAAEIAEAEPDISVRDLAEKAGVSRGTAHTAKRGHLADVSATPEERDEVTVGDLLLTLPRPWAKHPASLRSNDARDFARFMDRRNVRNLDGETADVLADQCPAELLDAAEADALANAAEWSRLAHLIGRRKADGTTPMEVVK